MTLTQRQRIVVIVLIPAVLDRDLERLRHLLVAGVLDKPLTREKWQGLLARYFPA